MNFGEGMKVAMFCLGMVFVLLASLYALIKLSSAIIRRYFSGSEAKGRQERSQRGEA